MTTPTPPPPSGPTGPATAAPGEEPGGTDLKPWIPAIALGVVLLVLLVVLLVTRTGDDGDTPATTTTTSSSTSTSTSTSTTSSTTSTTVAAPTTAPPTTVTTAAPPTSTTTTAPSTPAENAALVDQCNSGDEFACYEVGRLGLAPPSSLETGNRWYQAPDDEVVTGCQQQLNTTACYVAGSRGLVLTD